LNLDLISAVRAGNRHGLIECLKVIPEVARGN
jgi:hypothetical protein